MNPAASRIPARAPLGGDWFTCATQPGEAPPPADDARWIATAGPMTAAAALRAAGQWSLDGPALGFDAKDWWYRTHFDAPTGFKDGTWLGFDGLATSCEAWLNDTAILRSGSMFVAHECNVTTLLRARSNELRLRFDALDRLLEEKKPRPKWRTPMVAQQQLRWWRTTLLGRTPGWSPPCAPVGPWRDVWIERRAAGTQPMLHLDTSVQGTNGTVHCRWRSADPGAIASVDLRLEHDGRVEMQALSWNESLQCHEGRLRIADVRLWWPHTHGTPALYDASLSVRASGSETVVPAGRIGFRTIEIDTQQGDFALKVNGVHVFCRGAVWTPLDAVTLRSTPADCAAAVAQARHAGLNLLRVPGTGVYEEDHFHDACDAQGMLVWQDFMFANMDYPADDRPFAQAVEAEVRQQVERLRQHASLAVLCGNSEVEQQAAMWGATRDLWHPPLFHETLPAICRELAPRTAYWPSSAHGGAFPHQANSGTTSYYGVGAYERPLDDARRSGLRFATECLAFANVPSDETIARMPGGSAVRAHQPGWKARSPRDLGAGWDFDDVRDHYVERLFGVDAQRLRATDHARYLALGRVAAGEAMAASFSEWRRPGSPCRGAVVLMLRDLWAGAGWGLVDDSGRPKACWHYIKRALQPLAILISDEGVNGLCIHVVNDCADEQSLVVELAAWRDGDVKVAGGGRTITVPARGGASLPALELLDYFMDLGYAYRFGPLPCEAVTATLRDMDGRRLGEAFHFPGGLPLSREADVGLAAVLESFGEASATLRIATKRLATGVHVDMPGFIADDDYFHLPPGGRAHVRLRRTGDKAPAGFVHALNSAHAVRIETAKS